jgi:hypothetical protein
MMTHSNDMFVAAMSTFPKTSKKIVHLYHVGLGECLAIKCDGITSLCEGDLSAEMNFLDMNQAYRDGMFGANAKIWRDDEWSLLLDYLSGGIAHSQEDWELLTWQPQVWNTETMSPSTATKARNGWIRDLAARAANADGYLKIKGFAAADALSTITESTACNSDGDESEATFTTVNKEIWDKALAREMKHIKTKAGGTAKVARGNTLGKTKRADRVPTRGNGSSTSSAAKA